MPGAENLARSLAIDLARQRVLAETATSKNQQQRLDQAFSAIKAFEHAHGPVTQLRDIKGSSNDLDKISVAANIRRNSSSQCLADQGHDSPNSSFTGKLPPLDCMLACFPAGAQSARSRAPPWSLTAKGGCWQCRFAPETTCKRASNGIAFFAVFGDYSGASLCHAANMHVNACTATKICVAFCACCGIMLTCSSISMLRQCRCGKCRAVTSLELRMTDFECVGPS